MKRTDKEKGIKTFTVRFQKEDWLFVKHRAAIEEKSMQSVIKHCVKMYEKKLRNKLTESDTVV